VAGTPLSWKLMARCLIRAFGPFFASRGEPCDNSKGPRLVRVFRGVGGLSCDSSPPLCRGHLLTTSWDMAGLNGSEHAPQQSHMLTLGGVTARSMRKDRHMQTSGRGTQGRLGRRLYCSSYVVQRPCHEADDSALILGHYEQPRDETWSTCWAASSRVFKGVVSTISTRDSRGWAAPTRHRTWAEDVRPLSSSNG
jgi:hypothetical protein